MSYCTHRNFDTMSLGILCIKFPENKTYSELLMIDVM